jgi:Secretion system C-terminal sorting domain
MTMKKILLFSLLSLLCAVSNAATYYWVAPFNGDWNLAANWSATDGGAGGAGVPMFSSDVANINTNSTIKQLSAVTAGSININANVTFDGSFNLTFTNVNIGSGKTLILTKGNSITVSCSTIAGNGTLDLSSTGGLVNLELTGSIFVTTIKGNYTGLNISTIKFIGNSAQTLQGTIESTSRISVTVNNPANGLSLGGDTYIPQVLNLSNGSFITLGSANLSVLRIDGYTGDINSTGGVVVTNGTGKVTVRQIGTFLNGKYVPVGISKTSKDVIYIDNATGTNDYTVSVRKPSTSGGFTCAGVNIARALDREWNITSASTNANVEFFPDPSVGTVTGTAVIGHCVGASWTSVNSAEGMNVGFPYSATFNSFSPFIVASSGFLPVELVSFKANQKNNTNLLTWQTASEKNNSRFDIERSTTGQEDWVKLGTVKGSGNSQITHDYTFIDNTPLSISYYRLKQVDNDGSFEYSNVVSVTKKGDKFKIYTLSPNPTKDNIAIQFESNKNEVVGVSVMDMTGRVVLTQNASATEGVNFLNVNTSSLSNGMYVVSLKNSESVILNKIIKQ